MRPMDLNADLGEGFGVWRLGDDDALLGVVTSANVACGFHAGDPTTMRHVCDVAAARGVAVGAQVSYPDLAGFGRRYLDMANRDLADAVLYQIGALDTLARAAGSRVSYVKAHGALYSATVTDEGQAAAVVSAVAAAGDPAGGLPLLGLPGSVLLRSAAAAGLATVAEAFADRAYTPAGRLVPRGQPGAVLSDAAAMCAQATRIATTGEVVALDGSVVTVEARSLCVHGDTPGAVQAAVRVREALLAAGVPLQAFSGS